MYHGQGTCQFRDGHMYKGELNNGLLHGKGQFTWTDGTVYKGQFTQNEITGVGRYQWPDQSTYEGEVQNGLRHGKGKYINVDEGVEYEGEWKDGMRDGEGVLTYNNGSVYTGRWERGMKWGQGKMTYASGNYYEGEWANNKRNGQGTMFWLTSQEKYEGQWEDNFQSGFGTHVWLDGSTENKLLRNRYVGYWKLGQRHGKGVFYYSNGSQYEGSWIDNFKHGEGVFTFEDGTQYIGPFENDRMVNRAVSLKDAQDFAKNNPDSPKKVGEDTKKGSTKKSTKSKGDTAKKSSLGASSAKELNESQRKFIQNRAKKEVEENPFKKLIDISDIMEIENNSEEVLKEVQNCMLRHNSELKQWYRVYSRKIECIKNEDSFAMTLRQVWRFMRDTHLVGAGSTLAMFDRLYDKGKKNHFLLLKSDEKDKFDRLYLAEKKAEGQQEQKAQANLSDDEDETQEAIDAQALSQADDVHDPSKLVLQRQFFDAVVRAASVKFSSGKGGADLQTLSLQLEHLFKNNFASLAVKNKSKSVEDDKAFRVADKVFGEYSDKLTQVFNFFSQASHQLKNGKQDATISVDQIIELLTKANLLDGKTTDLKLEEVINMIEKYYDPESTLKTKLADDKWQAYLDLNPHLKREKPIVEEEIKEGQGEEDKPEEDKQVDPPAEDDQPKEDPPVEEDQELIAAMEAWKSEIISEHLVYIKGVEIIF